MGNEQASMKPFATPLLQATVVVLAVVFVFATDVAAGPDDGLPVEDLATEEGPNGEVSQRKGHGEETGFLVEDQLQTDVRGGSSANPNGFTCGKQCIVEQGFEYCCWCGSSEAEFNDYMGKTSANQIPHHGTIMASGSIHFRPMFVSYCFIAKEQWCKSNCWGEILAEKSSAASRKDSLDLADLLADVRGIEEEKTNSLTDVQARVDHGVCRPGPGGWSG